MTRTGFFINDFKGIAILWPKIKKKALKSLGVYPISLVQYLTHLKMEESMISARKEKVFYELTLE